MREKKENLSSIAFIFVNLGCGPNSFQASRENYFPRVVYNCSGTDDVQGEQRKLNNLFL